MPQTAKTTPERLTVTVEEAARLLGISRQSAYQAARAGELPGVIRIGRRLLVSRAQIDRMLGISPENGFEPAGNGLERETATDAMQGRERVETA
jgi:excisionase family DNA binding protein